jgi:predicted RNA-binding Zn ribbon-like protein
MTPVFLGSHPAMDFLNTSMTPQGEPVELIGDGAAFVDWLVAAGLLELAVAAKAKRRFDAAALDAAATAARQLRGWTRDWVVRWRDAPTADYGAEVRRLNALLAGARFFRQVVPTADGLGVAERMHVDTAADLVALVVPSIAALFVDEQPAFVRRCAGHACTLMFVDRTKAHRRVFCSASTCGNRAKVAAFRARQRGE